MPCQRPLVPLVIALIALVDLHPARGEYPVTPTTKPLVTVAGADSKIEDPTYLRISSREEFIRLFMRHLGKERQAYDEHYNSPAMPQIDFDQCMVLAIFAGKSVNTVGLFADSIQELDGRILFRFRPRCYQTLDFGNDTSGGDGSNHANPFGFFVIPRSDKAIVVEEDVQNVIGSPPKWEEKARIAPLEK